MWGYSGGAVEIDEKIEDCARRELFEEMGITAGELELFYINSGPEAHYVYPNGDEVSNVEIVYICRDYRGEIRPQQEEIEEIRYFSVEEIQMEEISPPIRPVLQKYKLRLCKPKGNDPVIWLQKAEAKELDNSVFVELISKERRSTSSIQQSIERKYNNYEKTI